MAVHAVLLAAFLSLKFLTAKSVLLMAMAGGLLWLMLGRKPRLVPAARHGMRPYPGG
ncbi:MAG: hypothetical protein NTX21_11290 [Alphaproteobacteria bacterium]|nr:hypothetical protein [Alphaproteobacteria bacterium]